VKKYDIVFFMSESFNFQQNGNHSVEFGDWCPIPSSETFTPPANLSTLLANRNRLVRESQSIKSNRIRSMIVKIDYVLNSRKSPSADDVGARIAVDKMYGLISNESDEIRIDKIQEDLRELRIHLSGRLNIKS
jgi:hypothetical protein